jgi:S-DNA-T family DNA segregation ATPase FtsK/SpoIIIE
MTVRSRDNVDLEYTKSRRLREITGVLALLGSLYLALSLFTYDRWDNSLFTFSRAPVKNYGGVVGAYLSDAVLSVVGLGGYIVPLFLIVFGVKKILGKEGSKLHALGVALFLLSVALLLQTFSKILPFAFEDPGGAAGVLLSHVLVGFLSRPGALIAGAAMLLVSLILMTPVSPFALIAGMRRKTPKPRTALPAASEEEWDAESVPEEAATEEITVPQPREERPFAYPTPAVKGSYVLPPLELLREATEVPRPPKEELTTAAAALERKLADFGVQGRIRQAHPGPVVTMYEFEPAPGVKINRIVSLSDDIALSLRSPSIRVYPIAGKATIGIEVPNRLRAPVAIREVIASESFVRSTSLLTIALGKDIFGGPVVTDLAKMPHLLVAGATGSGKSVSINAMIISMLYKATPDEVKMLLIDPKLLELSAYEQIPHLISPVITSPKAASEALKKVVLEMERRYRVLALKGARNIETYNASEESERLPYIVVFIDELADLMFTAPADVENAIARLAQMARAAGIHLILATQRPSVDVITGLIKANFPARISFQVTSKIDSRTILDAQGAEQLVGMGDMLLMVPGMRTVRVHGAYVSESEVRAVTEFIKAHGAPDYTAFESLVVADDKAPEEGEGERDAMYEKVIEFAESVGEVSISSIQRRFKIGYNRAARIMELLEEDALVGPPKGAGKPRDFIRRKHT